MRPAEWQSAGRHTEAIDPAQLIGDLPSGGLAADTHHSSELKTDSAITLERGFGGIHAPRVFAEALGPGLGCPWFNCGSSSHLAWRPIPQQSSATRCAPAATPPSLGVAQKVSRRGEPLALLGPPQAVEQRLHSLVDRPLGPFINRVGQQRPRPHQSAQFDARHVQSPRRRRHATAFVEKLSLDSPEANRRRRVPTQLH